MNLLTKDIRVIRLALARRNRPLGPQDVDPVGVRLGVLTEDLGLQNVARILRDILTPAGEDILIVRSVSPRPRGEVLQNRLRNIRNRRAWGEEQPLPLP